MSRSDLLLDKHVALWWLDESPRIVRRARLLIEQAAWVWLRWLEIAFKVSMGKMKGPDGLPDLFVDSGFGLLAISADHSWEVRRLEPRHFDPSDGLRVARARCEGPKLITADRKLAACGALLLCF